MLAEQVPGPRQGQGRGLVAGEEQRHRLVADLLVGHAAAVVLVAGVQQDREQVALVHVLRRGAGG